MKIPVGPISAAPHKCQLPFEDPNGEIVYFDVQSARPGDFTIPGVIDLEVYEPGSLVESSWIYIMGDLMAGPQPGHPFEMPFDNLNTKFAVDIVKADDSSTLVRHLMPPTLSKPFWDGGAPFGKIENYTMNVQMLDRSCKYYSIASMVYFWTIPEDLERNTDYRLKLVTDEPAVSSLSGLLRVSSDGTAKSSSLAVGELSHSHSLSSDNIVTICAAAGLLVMMFLALWRCSRLVRSSKRISLE